MPQQTVASQIAAIIRERDALRSAMGKVQTAAKIVQAKMDQLKAKIAELREENKTLKAEVRQLRREVANIKAQLRTPEDAKEAKPKAARKPRKSKASQQIVDVVLDEPTPEELEEEF
jgi:regulator of replication initiation timing